MLYDASRNKWKCNSSSSRLGGGEKNDFVRPREWAINSKRFASSFFLQPSAFYWIFTRYFKRRSRDRLEKSARVIIRKGNRLKIVSLLLRMRWPCHFFSFFPFPSNVHFYLINPTGLLNGFRLFVRTVNWDMFIVMRVEWNFDRIRDSSTESPAILSKKSF